MGNCSPTPSAGGGDRDVEILAAAVLDYARRPPHMGCVHVVRDGAGAILCALHPAAGLQCARCADRHTTRHDDAEERTCDHCRQVVDELHQVAGTIPLSFESVRDAKGHHRAFAGVVAVGGVGCCGPCREAEGRHEEAVDIPTAIVEKGWRP